MIKILIADDHAVVREGLKKILAEAKDMDVCGEASDGMSALLLMRSQNWDIVLLDISMPGKNGLDVLKAIRTEKPELRILMLSIYPESQYALRCLKAGASGYLTKESAPGQLIAAIRKVARGGKYISVELAEKLVSELVAPSERLLHEALSDRELEILRLMAAGHTPAQISEILFTSREQFLDELEEYFTPDEADRVLSVMIDWGRYAELFSYGYNSGILSEPTEDEATE